MRLYHTGYQEIRVPDIHYGRKNADFGQGFYMTDDHEFATRWARERRDASPVVNIYELDTSGLRIHTFERDADWFNYIFNNRRVRPDTLPGVDVVIGPIANDTLYDTFGIITSGMISEKEAMKLLMIGPAYRQVVLRTEKAAAQLQWLSSRVMSADEIRKCAAASAAESAAYQEQFAAVLAEE